jgi:4-amino-4-deoxy-L-arabinose transferase-like glycosyltransferase
MAVGSLYAYDVFDEFWWTLAATILIVLLRDERPKLWLAFGVVAGLGLLTKETIVFWGFALVVGLLLTSQRRLLFTRWTLFGGLIAFALFLPYLLWNAFNGWPTLQYFAGYSRNQLAGGTPLDFFIGQVVGMNPLSVLLWAAGLWYFFFSTRGARYRVFGWSFLILFVLFAVLQGKSYFSGLPTVVCRWGDGVGAWRVRRPRWTTVCRATGPLRRAVRPRSDAGVTTRRMHACIAQAARIAESWQHQRLAAKPGRSFGWRARSR